MFWKTTNFLDDLEHPCHDTEYYLTENPLGSELKYTLETIVYHFTYVHKR